MTCVLTVNLYFPNIIYWCGLHNPGTAWGSAGVQARAYGKGDDLAKSGTFDEVSSNNIDLQSKDIVYGAFDKIYMDDHVEYIFAIIGK